MPCFLKFLFSPYSLLWKLLRFAIILLDGRLSFGACVCECVYLTAHTLPFWAISTHTPTRSHTQEAKNPTMAEQGEAKSKRKREGRAEK